MEKKKGFFEGSFGKFVLPGIILQSVMIGGGYATGREIVEYGAKYGALGWLSGLGTFLGFAVIAALTYELIRLTKAYDFKTFMKTIGGPLWIVFDIVYLLFMVVIIAVMASATGNIVEQTLGLNYWVGVVAITVVVAILNFYGSRLIERFETLVRLPCMQATSSSPYWLSVHSARIFLLYLQTMTQALSKALYPQARLFGAAFFTAHTIWL